MVEPSPPTTCRDGQLGPAPLVGAAGPATMVVAVLATIAGVTLTTVYTLISPFGWAAAVAVAAGAVAGIEFVGFARSRVEVWPDRVRLTNLFRIVAIRREAIAGLRHGLAGQRRSGGIRILLRDGKYVLPTAFQPASRYPTFKPLKRDGTFPQEMADMLGVSVQLPYLDWNRTQPIPAGLVTRVLRRETLVAASVGAAAMLMLALVVLALSRVA